MRRKIEGGGGERGHPLGSRGHAVLKGVPSLGENLSSGNRSRQ